MTVAVSFLLRESAEVYQAQASEYLTSHQLADFRRCPLRTAPPGGQGCSNCWAARNSEGVSTGSAERGK